MKNVYRILVDVIIDDEEDSSIALDQANAVADAIRKLPVVFLNRHPGPVQVTVDNAFHHDSMM